MRIKRGFLTKYPNMIPSKIQPAIIPILTFVFRVTTNGRVLKKTAIIAPRAAPNKNDAIFTQQTKRPPPMRPDPATTPT